MTRREFIGALGTPAPLPIVNSQGPKDIVADTRANIEYVKKTFRMPANR